MSGNPAVKPSKKVYAYLLIDVAEERDPNIDTTGYVPQDPPGRGTITLREDNPGTGTHPFIFEDGPIKFICSGVYIGTGEENDDGAIVFDWGVTSLINLIAIGGNADNTLRRMVHEFADQMKAKIEEEMMPGKLIADTPARIIKAIDELEKSFFSRR